MTVKYRVNNDELNYYTTRVIERIESESKDDLIEAANLRTAIESTIQELSQQQIIKDKIVKEIETIRNENKHLANNEYQPEELKVDDDTIIMQTKIESDNQRLKDKQSEFAELKTKIQDLEEIINKEEEEAIGSFEKVIAECDKYCGLLKIAVDKQDRDKLILSFEDGYSLERPVIFTTEEKAKIIATGTPKPVEVDMSDPSSVSSFLLRLRNSFRIQ